MCFPNYCPEIRFVVPFRFSSLSIGFPWFFVLLGIITLYPAITPSRPFNRLKKWNMCPGSSISGGLLPIWQRRMDNDQIVVVTLINIMLSIPMLMPDYDDCHPPATTTPSMENHLSTYTVLLCTRRILDLNIKLSRPSAREIEMNGNWNNYH